MKRKAIKTLILTAAMASTLLGNQNIEKAFAMENNNDQATVKYEQDGNHGGFYRGDMSAGDAAKGLGNKDLPATASSTSKSTPTINGLKVSKQLIDINYSKGVVIQPKYIVIHDTDNRRVGADAQANRDYFANHPNANASAHYIIDQGKIVQALEDTWKGWHVGDGGAGASINNGNTIGIELAVNQGNDFKKTMENGIALTRYLMEKYNIPAENIVMHKHASGKTCSRMMIEDEPELWTIYKEKVAKGMAGESNIIDGKNPTATGTVKGVTSHVNIRATASSTSTVVSKLYKNAKVKIYGEENGFYKISYMETKKGYGYVSKDYVTVGGNVEVPDTGNPEPPVTVLDKTGQVYNVTTQLNVRSGPGTSYGIIGALKADEKVKIKGQSGEFYKIDFNGKDGFVSKNFIKIVEEVKPEPPKPVDPPVEPPKPVDPPVVEKKVGQVYNVTTQLNVRSGAGSNYSIIGSLKGNQKVDITGESGNWYKIDYSGKAGYVSKDFIKIVTETPNPEPPKPVDPPKPEEPTPPAVTEREGQVVGVTTKLNVRAGAGTNYTVIGSLTANQKVKITGESGSWYKIDFNGKVGYVSKEFMKVVSTGGSTGGNNNGGSTGGNTGGTTNPGTPSESTKTGKVTGLSTSLNVRSGAGTNYGVIGSLSLNATVKITGESGTWYKIDFNGKTGYVSKQYITITSSGNTGGSTGGGNNSGSTVKTGTVYNITTKLNVRSSASTSGSVIGQLSNGAKVSITGESGNWYKIDYNGKVGYVSKDFVK
ncbi:MAG: SH3 domain-containing protein [Sarcina sp.]